MSRRATLTRFWHSELGSSAMEFVLVVPVMIMLTIGVINASLMIYSVATVHFAAQDAARWCVIHASTCATDLSTYKYAGFASPTFTLTSPATCAGQQVTGTATYTFVTGMANISLPISATACHPFG